MANSPRDTGLNCVLQAVNYPFRRPHRQHPPVEDNSPVEVEQAVRDNLSDTPIFGGDGVLDAGNETKHQIIYH